MSAAPRWRDSLGAAPSDRLDPSIRNGAGKLMLLFDIHTRDELARALNNPKRAERIGNPSDKEVLSLMAPGESVERWRPFLEEPVWAIFYGYRALLGRILFMLKDGREKGHLEFWLDDAYTRGLLSALVEPDELAGIEAQIAGGIGEAQRIIELKLADAARRWSAAKSRARRR